MTSPSSSSTESSSPLSSSSTLSNFDPFAIHPFTNCSQVNQNNAPRNPLYGYTYGPSNGNHGGPHPSQSTNSAKPTIPSRSPTAPYGYTPRPAGIFEPFRKDTSSPELGDVLKKSVKTTNSPPNTTGNPVKPIPISRNY